MKNQPLEVLTYWHCENLVLKYFLWFSAKWEKLEHRFTIYYSLIELNLTLLLIQCLQHCDVFECMESPNARVRVQQNDAFLFLFDIWIERCYQCNLWACVPLSAKYRLFKKILGLNHNACHFAGYIGNSLIDGARQCKPVGLHSALKTFEHQSVTNFSDFKFATGSN